MWGRVCAWVLGGWLGMRDDEVGLDQPASKQCWAQRASVKRHSLEMHQNLLAALAAVTETHEKRHWQQ